MIRKAVEAARAQGEGLLSGPIARGSIQSLAIRVAGLGLAFVTAIVTARLLGPEGYGILAFAGSLASILATISMLGLGPLAVRHVPVLRVQEDYGAISGFILLSVKLTCLVAAVLAVALVAVAHFTTILPANSFPIYVIAALMVLPQSLLVLTTNWLKSFGHIAVSQVPGEIFRPILMLCMLASIYLAGIAMQPEFFLTAILAAATATLIVSMVWLWRLERKNFSPEIKRPLARGTVRTSMPFLGLALVAMLQGEINTLMLSWLSGPRETGLFQPIWRFSNLMIIGVTAASVAYAPKIAELWERGEIEKIRSITAKFTLTTFCVTLAIGLAIAAAGPWILAAFGPEFVSVAPLLWVMAAAQIFNASCGPVGLLLMMGGRGEQALIGQAIGLVVNVVVGVVLIPDHGIWGAALALTTGLVLRNFISLVLVQRRFSFNSSIVGVILK
ncbi:MAG: oligosaccharide flippase family protein [Erythrobacter sp.]